MTVLLRVAVWLVVVVTVVLVLVAVTLDWEVVVVPLVAVSVSVAVVRELSDDRVVVAVAVRDVDGAQSPHAASQTRPLEQEGQKDDSQMFWSSSTRKRQFVHSSGLTTHAWVLVDVVVIDT